MRRQGKRPLTWLREPPRLDFIRPTVQGGAWTGYALPLEQQAEIPVGKIKRSRVSIRYHWARFKVR